jgi:hypothetical protein
VQGRGHFLEGLLDLGRASDAVARRALFRQSLVSLGQATARSGPAPLQGVEPNALVPGMRMALSDGLLDDLQWLAPDSAAVALYEIASALPAGFEKREVARRVAVYTYEGAADTFAAVATRMALASNKALSGASLAARVALTLELALGTSSRAPALALALATRRDLVKEWIARPSRGSLPARRLAARLIERSAAEAARLATSGEEDAARVFRSESLSQAYRELLWDREPLVWKHVAIARGLLAGAMPEMADEIEAHCASSLSPTEWRRAATSLGASVGAEPASASRRIHEWLGSGILARDADVAGCVLWGLAHSALLEPDAAEEMALVICQKGGTGIADAYEQAARENPGWSSTRSAALVRRALRQHLSPHHAEPTSALAAELLADLDAPSETMAPSVRKAVAEALSAFASHGPKRAYELALAAFSLGEERVAVFEAMGEKMPEAQAERLALLRDLDIALLQSATLAHLLALGRRLSDAAGAELPDVEMLHDRLGQTLLEEEAAEAPGGATARPRLFPLQRIKALIHVLDAELDPDSEASTRSARVRARWLRAAHTLVDRVASSSPNDVPRSLSAALARALEGLVRAEVCDPVEALLFAACRLNDKEHFSVLAEASRQPELAALFSHYAAFLEQAGTDDGTDELWRRRAALERWAGALSGENSSGEQALRAVLIRLSRALEAIQGASSLSDLASDRDGESAMAALAEAGGSLIQMVAASAQRISGPLSDGTPGSLRNPTSGLLRAARRVVAEKHGELPGAVDELVARIGPSLPPPLATIVAATLDRARVLPKDPPPREPRSIKDWTLPPWMPARRSLGGFYVLKPLGDGGSGSVFVAKRIEERDDPQAEAFALKVPAYTSQIARHMPEAAFLQQFRNEASALLSLPLHPNLARFVTFDLGARPKPILVMELVEGISLDLVITRRQLTTGRALALLDGVLAGLEAMHAAGIAHLDVKPANVVLRNEEEPVLVDFGLAGRHLRPGCGSGPYGAPEVWGVVSDGGEAPATFADVYAVACLVYEMLTTQPLFDQPTEVAVISAHVAHDGWPMPLRSWHRQRRVAELAELLGRGLRRRPRDRIDVPSFRKKLATLAPALSELSWPLSP